MKQTRRASLAEATVNVLIGYGIALLTQIAVFWAMDIDVSLGQDVVIGLLFTVVSLVRSYVLRRVFEVLRVKRILP